MSSNSDVPPPVGADKKTIAVIGGGVTGTLCAWELARSGHKVTLIEARSLGAGSSSRSAACIRAQFSTPSTVRGMRYCIGFYENWLVNIGGDQLPIVQNGYLFLKDYNVSKEEVKKLVAMQHEAGLAEVEWLDRRTLEQRFPYLEPTGLIGATFCPKDGFLLPHLVYQDAAEAARLLGVEIVQNDQALVVNRSGDLAQSLALESGRVVTADLFVNATNAWASHVSGLFGGYSLPIKVRRRYLYFLQGLNSFQPTYAMLPEDFRQLPMVITPQGAYCRPDNEQLMIGWLHFTRPIEPDFDNQDVIEPGFAAGDMSGYGVAVRKAITAFLPDCENMGRLMATTCGFYADTEDHNPLIDFDPFVKNLIHVAGFSGHGLMHAPFSARIVAELVAAEQRLGEISLPGFGFVDTDTYWVDREFHHGEGMVI